MVSVDCDIPSWCDWLSQDFYFKLFFNEIPSLVSGTQSLQSNSKSRFINGHSKKHYIDTTCFSFSSSADFLDP